MQMMYWIFFDGLEYQFLYSSHMAYRGRSNVDNLCVLYKVLKKSHLSKSEDIALEYYFGQQWKSPIQTLLESKYLTLWQEMYLFIKSTHVSKLYIWLKMYSMHSTQDQPIIDPAEFV